MQKPFNMTLLARFIDSLNAKYHRSACQTAVHPVQSEWPGDNFNVIAYLNKGHLSVGKNETAIEPGSFYFFPQGKKITMKHGKGPAFSSRVESFCIDEASGNSMHTISGLSDFSKMKEVVTFVCFDVLLYNAIPFFSILGIPSFPLPPDEEFAYLVRHIALEEEQNKLGREKIISNYMQEIVIHMCRYIDSQPHLKKYIEKLDYLTDKRLIDIVRYIENNLDKELSNKQIAHVAMVSEDYVGQFFKSLTNHNLQQYVENQRLEKAMQLLSSQPDNVREIARTVGFKDAAYFSRRFKMKFGANALSMRIGNWNQLVRPAVPDGTNE
jgi:AraC-like DNA-binding protein